MRAAASIVSASPVVAAAPAGERLGPVRAHRTDAPPPQGYIRPAPPIVHEGDRPMARPMAPIPNGGRRACRTRPRCRSSAISCRRPVSPSRLRDHARGARRARPAAAAAGALSAARRRAAARAKAGRQAGAGEARARAHAAAEAEARRGEANASAERRRSDPPPRRRPAAPLRRCRLPLPAAAPAPAEGRCRARCRTSVHKIKAPRKDPGRSALFLSRRLLRQRPWSRPPAAWLCR